MVGPVGSLKLEFTQLPSTSASRRCVRSTSTWNHGSFLEVTKLRPPKTRGIHILVWCETSTRIFMVRTKEITTPRLQYRCQSLSLPVGIQSPKLRMVSWNLNAARFGGDYTPLAHHLTRWARILRGHVHSRKLRCPLEKGPFWWKDSKFLRGDILVSSFSRKQKIRGG